MSKNTDLSELINHVKSDTNGRLNFPFYTSTTSFTGTVAGYLAFDASGNVLTSSSATTQWITSGSDIYYNSGNVTVGGTSPKLTAINRGNITINGSSSSILTMSSI